MYEFTKEDIELVEKFIDIRNRGYYANSVQVTSMYNKVLNKNVQNTTCGSCLRQRISELERQLTIWKVNNAKKAEEKKKEENNDGGTSTAHKARKAKTGKGSKPKES